MFDPIRNGVKAVGTTVMAVPDQVFEGVTKMGVGINNAAKIIIVSKQNFLTTDKKHEITEFFLV